MGPALQNFKIIAVQRTRALAYVYSEGNIVNIDRVGEIHQTVLVDSQMLGAGIDPIFKVVHSLEIGDTQAIDYSLLHDNFADIPFSTWEISREAHRDWTDALAARRFIPADYIFVIYKY